MIDARRLRRLYPRQDFDAERFAEFHWLIVEEVVVLEQEPEERAVPVLFMALRLDLGRGEPPLGGLLYTPDAAVSRYSVYPGASLSTT